MSSRGAEAIRRAIEIRERSYHTSFRPQPGAAVGMTPVRIVDPTATHPVLCPDVDDWLGAEAYSLLDIRERLDPPQ